MVKPKTKGSMIPIRLSIEATEELERRAAKAGLSPREHLVAQLERSLTPKPMPVDEPQFLGKPLKEGPQVVVHRDGKPLLGVTAVADCRHWRKTTTDDGMLCLQCLEIVG